jgi:hypothetical protein
MHIDDELQCCLVVLDETSKGGSLGFCECTCTWPVLTAYLFFSVFIKLLPVHAPIAVQVGASIFVSAHGDVVWIHILSLINNFSFVNVLLFNILGSVRVDDRNEEESKLHRHVRRRRWRHRPEPQLGHGLVAT